MSNARVKAPKWSARKRIFLPDFVLASFRRTRPHAAVLREESEGSGGDRTGGHLHKCIVDTDNKDLADVSELGVVAVLGDMVVRAGRGWINISTEVAWMEKMLWVKKRRNMGGGTY